MKSRFLKSVFTIPIAGVIGLIGLVLRGPNAMPLPDVDAWAQVATQSVFMTSQMLVLVGYTLPLIGFWALHRYLEKLKIEILSFWGFVLSLFGTVLALPALGITAFVGPIAAQSYILGNTGAVTLINEALTGPGFIFSIAAAVCYTLGPLLFGLALWKSKVKKWVSLLFMIHGACLSFGFSMFPMLLIGWVLLTVSAFEIARCIFYLPETEI